MSETLPTHESAPLQTKARIEKALPVHLAPVLERTIYYAYTPETTQIETNVTPHREVARQAHPEDAVNKKGPSFIEKLKRDTGHYWNKTTEAWEHADTKQKVSIFIGVSSLVLGVLMAIPGPHHIMAALAYVAFLKLGLSAGTAFLATASTQWVLLGAAGVASIGMPKCLRQETHRFCGRLVKDLIEEAKEGAVGLWREFKHDMIRGTGFDHWSPFKKKNKTKTA